MSSATQKIDPDAKAAPKPADVKDVAKPKASKPRIDCIDGCRFALAPWLSLDFYIFMRNITTISPSSTQLCPGE